MSERTLVVWLGQGPAWRDAATLGLGDLATLGKELGDAATTALLDTIETHDGPPNDMAFYALSRGSVRPALRARVVRAAKAALSRPGDARLFAIKTIARWSAVDANGAADLADVVTRPTNFTLAERAEAARALGVMGAAGHEAAAGALATLSPMRDVSVLLSGEYHVLHLLVGALGEAPPASIEPTLFALASLKPPSPRDPKLARPLARRVAELRCASALGLARGVSDAEVLLQCDDRASEISERARLTALLRRPLDRDRRVAFRAFTKSRHLRIRELAIEALATHQEVSDLAAEVLAEALASEEAGLVATAAEALHAHPELAMVLAASEKRAGLDPRSPPPSRTPKKERSRKVDEALGAALKKTFPEDRFETRIALIEALTSLEHPGAKVAAEGACVDANPVVRSRALRALRTMGAGIEACSGQPRALAPAPELEGLLTKPTRIVLETEATELAIVLDPALSPRAASRIASLVQTGFYDGIEVHRVVPGFVVQFGDPGGDGYGGSGVSLRCETSPVPFRTLDVGMALAGRDTGSSQLFVTLARTPHLDGAYTRIGHAEGDWARLALHDRIVRARLVE